MDIALTVRSLRAYYLTRYFGIEREVRAVYDITLSVKKKEIYGIAGESSCGKSTFIKTIAAAIRPPLRILGGSIKYSFLDRDLYDLDERALADMRWKHLSCVLQGSMNVLNPVRRVRESFKDFAFPHMGLPRSEFIDVVNRHLERLHLSPLVLSAFPHELSGGMRQRVAIALATVCRPEFIIADEPTTALDVVVQKDVLSLILETQRQITSSMIFVTHDLAVHANISNRLGIMHAGRLVEEGPTGDILHDPMHPYTRHLVASLPRIGDLAPKAPLPGAPPNLAEPPSGCRFHPRCPLAMDICRQTHPELTTLSSDRRVACYAVSTLVKPAADSATAPESNPGGQVRGVSPVNELLCVEHVTRTFAIGGLLGRAQFAAVDDVSFSLESARPEIFAIIGESGSGKTTLARIILKTLAPTRGLIRFLGQDISRLRGRWDRLRFMQKVQPILQNPYEAFNPLKQVDRYLFASAVHFLGCRSRDAREVAADAALRKVGLSLAEVKGRFPHELSGGQLQRAAIARALISSPALIVADEPVSMIDASLRMSIVNLFKTLRDELKVSIIYITHDLATAYYISDRVLIMQKGKVVETGLARQVLSNPQHPYTILLRQSILSPDDVDKARPG